ncbi:MAG: hypothetical protein ACK4EX_11360 [Thermaurantimonas sp.]|uniref:hypothetical protein n=1 Tax=Thermaurantimonas sp. TaxID=2681568 RepID=UPI00391D85B2
MPRTLYAVSEKIEDNSIVLPINFSDHWMEIHFSNYIGCTKPLILLENYESTVNWFPIILNYNKLPNIFLHQKNFIPGVEWKHNPDSENKRQIDYVVIYGNAERLNDPVCAELKD